MEASLPEGVQLQREASEQHTDTHTHAHRFKCYVAERQIGDPLLLSYHAFLSLPLLIHYLSFPALE